MTLFASPVIVRPRVFHGGTEAANFFRRGIRKVVHTFQNDLTLISGEVTEMPSKAWQDFLGGHAL